MSLESLERLTVSTEGKSRFNFSLGRPNLSSCNTDGYGTIGIAPGVEIMHVKVLRNEDGRGQMDWIIRGILYAAENGADIINMSLGMIIDKQGIKEAFGGSVTTAIAQEKNAVCSAVTYA